MKRSLLAAVFCLSSLAGAQSRPPSATAAEPPKAQAMAPDFSKSGPWTRKPDEKKTHQEIDEFLKQEEALSKKGDTEAMLARLDFPVFMLTDDAKGMPESNAVSREAYIRMMQPFWDTMPKDSQTMHKYTTVVLSNSLASVTDDFVMTMGKQKYSGRNNAMLIKTGAGWRWKVMTEAGWGGMTPPPQAATSMPPQPQPKSPAATTAPGNTPTGK